MTTTTTRLLLFTACLSLALGAAGCALDDESNGSGSRGDRHVVEQPVELVPIFELNGLDELPGGIHLDELHVGVGAIFLDRIGDGDSDVAYANNTPFRLHFDIADGRLEAEAPAMVLPQGGRYQVSVQIEPQALLTQTDNIDGVRSLDAPEGEASLIVGGRVYDTEVLPPDGDDDEPAPLPWHPVEEIEEVDQLRRNVNVYEFSVTSRRTVRFVLDEVELTNGSRAELVMQLQVGSWVEDTIRPALYEALGEMADGQPSTDRVDGVELDLGERIESGDGMDGLIGGIDIELR